MPIAQDPSPVCDYSEIFTELAQSIVDIPGEVAEFGVYNGGSSYQLARITGRTVYAFDTYSGVPSEDFDPNLDHDQPGKFKSNDSTIESLTGHASIVPVIGRFADTLPTISGGLKFVFVYIDCDLYTSAKQVLDWLPDHLVSGAIVFFDDYGSHKGINKAVDEFVATWSEVVIPVRSRGSSFYFVWNKKDN